MNKGLNLSKGLNLFGWFEDVGAALAPHRENSYIN